MEADAGRPNLLPRHREISRFAKVFRFGYILLALVLPVCAPTLSARAGTATFSLNDVTEMAEALAHEPYRPPEPLPIDLSQVSGEQWRKIRFLGGSAPWPESNRFKIRLFHMGYLYAQPVRIHVVDALGVHPFRFSPHLFDYADTGIGQKLTENLGFAGFMVSYPLQHPDSADEIISFLGASFFRAVGKQQQFGLSARGIAIDTASNSNEQHPYFKEFWLLRPAAQADSMRIYALLDGESVTGAYQFQVYPGEKTVLKVQATVFLRNRVDKLGIVPLTSMFLQGANSPKQYSTLEPQVHHSDGLSIKTQDNRWIWRPLQNPGRLSVYSFVLNNPQGFGLMQRERRFCSYEALSQHYHQRPSAWVTLHGKWGRGLVQLIEIPSDNRNNDNIVAFWVPDKQPEPLQPATFSYDISWQGDRMTLPDVGHVVNTRTGEKDDQKEIHIFKLDFTGGALQGLPAESASAAFDVAAPAELIHHQIVANPYVNGLRLEFQVKADDQPVQMRIYLKADDRTITETWDYVFQPQGANP